MAELQRMASHFCWVDLNDPRKILTKVKDGHIPCLCNSLNEYFLLKLHPDSAFLQYLRYWPGIGNRLDHLVRPAVCKVDLSVIKSGVFIGTAYRFHTLIGRTDAPFRQPFPFAAPKKLPDVRRKFASYCHR